MMCRRKKSEKPYHGIITLITFIGTHHRVPQNYEKKFNCFADILCDRIINVSYG